MQLRNLYTECIFNIYYNLYCAWFWAFGCIYDIISWFISHIIINLHYLATHTWILVLYSKKNSIEFPSSFSSCLCWNIYFTYLEVLSFKLFSFYWDIYSTYFVKYFIEIKIYILHTLLYIPRHINEINDILRLFEIIYVYIWEPKTKSTSKPVHAYNVNNVYININMYSYTSIYRHNGMCGNP